MSVSRIATAKFIYLQVLVSSIAVDRLGRRFQTYRGLVPRFAARPQRMNKHTMRTHPFCTATKTYVSLQYRNSKLIERMKDV
jgi:hypothetical protein